jgi:hypothetical protein
VPLSPMRRPSDFVPSERTSVWIVFHVPLCLSGPNETSSVTRATLCDVGRTILATNRVHMQVSHISLSDIQYAACLAHF